METKRHKVNMEPKELAKIISPEKFRAIANWMDKVDSEKGIEVQNDLRKFADKLDELINPKTDFEILLNDFIEKVYGQSDKSVIKLLLEDLMKKTIDLYLKKAKSKYMEKKLILPSESTLSEFVKEETEFRARYSFANEKNESFRHGLLRGFELYCGEILRLNPQNK